jgi:hypothetical protein
MGPRRAMRRSRDYRSTGRDCFAIGTTGVKNFALRIVYRVSRTRAGAPADYNEA